MASGGYFTVHDVQRAFERFRKDLEERINDPLRSYALTSQKTGRERLWTIVLLDQHGRSLGPVSWFNEVPGNHLAAKMLQMGHTVLRMVNN